MSSLLELVSLVRGWRIWGMFRRPLSAPVAAPVIPVLAARPILREVSPNGVRVYSLCNACGTTLGASATLCDACARSRPMRRA
ncbi:MAG: hypothetical protein JWL60_2033 [Gemmatimonadetes bacterium]|jgi:hypothetical protein|nr:hypothetical protein [Gemmatimonadota bacterium]